MKGDDLDFASKLSLMQRHIETAQLNIDSANEMARGLVGGFEKMQRILMAEEFRRQEHLAEQTRRDGMMTANQFAEEFLNFATGKRTTEPIISGPANGPSIVDQVFTQKPKKNMTTTQLEQLAKAREAYRVKQLEAGTTNGDATPISNRKLKPIERKFSKEWGMYPYPHFIKTYIEQNPSATFQAEDVAKLIEELGYAAEMKPIRQALSHQAANGVIRNTIVGKDRTSQGHAGVYVAIAGKTILGVAPRKKLTSSASKKSWYKKKGTFSAHGKRLGRPPADQTEYARRAAR